MEMILLALAVSPVVIKPMMTLFFLLLSLFLSLRSLLFPMRSAPLTPPLQENKHEEYQEEAEHYLFDIG